MGMARGGARGAGRGGTWFHHLLVVATEMLRGGVCRGRIAVSRATLLSRCDPNRKMLLLLLLWWVNFLLYRVDFLRRRFGHSHCTGGIK